MLLSLHCLPLLCPIKCHRRCPTGLRPSPELLTWFLPLQTANVLVAWPGQSHPPSFHWQESYCLPRPARLWGPQHCINHLVVSLTPCLQQCPSIPPLCLSSCSVWNTAGPPPYTFQSQAFRLVRRQQSCREKQEGLVLHWRDEWACRVEKFNKCRQPLGNVSLCGLNISCISPISEVYCFKSMCAVFWWIILVRHCTHEKPPLC